MRPRVKICGLTSRAAVEAAVGADVDAIGFVFAESPRRVEPAAAAEWTESVPERVARVAVFHHPTRRAVEEVLDRVRPDWVQTDAEDLPRLGLPAAVRVLPVFRDLSGVEGSFDGFRRASGARRPRVMFEGARSGRGERPDWERAAALARSSRLVLAGGLSPENVGEAIRAVRPYAVDVSSGVESGPGVKDPDRIRAFVGAVRRADRRPARHAAGEVP